MRVSSSPSGCGPGGVGGGEGGGGGGRIDLLSYVSDPKAFEVACEGELFSGEEFEDPRVREEAPFLKVIWEGRKRGRV